MKPTVFAEAVALLGRCAANGMPLPQKSPAGFSADVAMITRAAVDAAQTGDAGWLGTASPFGDVVAAFFPSLQPDCALMKAITRGLTVPTPLRAAVAAAVTNVSAYTRGEGHAIPLTRFSLQRRVMTPESLDALIVVTAELLAIPGASELVQVMLQQGCGSILDAYFHNVMADSSTASFNASGTTATAFFADLKLLFAAVFPTGTSVARAFIVTDAATALAVSLLVDSTGQLAVPSMGLSGGLIMGIPAFVSGGWPANKLSLFNGSRICTALDNSIGLSASGNAVVEMSDAPAGDASQGVAVQAVSMFATHAAAIKLSMRASVERAIDSACGEIVGCGYL